METFDDQDQPYLAWLLHHTGGFVLNRHRGESASYLVLHRATCRSIQGYNNRARPGGFTSRKYIKICADTVPELVQYARTKGGLPDGSFSSRCKLCSP